MNLEQVYLFSSLTSIPVEQCGFLDGASNVAVALLYSFEGCNLLWNEQNFKSGGCRKAGPHCPLWTFIGFPPTWRACGTWSFQRKDNLSRNQGEGLFWENFREKLMLSRRLFFPESLVSVTLNFKDLFNSAYNISSRLL